MKIANSRYYGVLAASMAGILLLVAFPPAQAQTTVTALATEQSAATVAAAAEPMPMPSPIMEKSGNMANLANPPAGPGVGASSGPGKDHKPEATEENDKKIPGQVTDIVKKLQAAKVDLSLEDMNQARGALARLDLLLELEQKMGDLDKARAKRAAAENMADEVSALLPRGVARMPGRVSVAAADVAPPAVVAPVAAPVVMRQPPAGTYTVQRISGVDGNYTALLRDASDEKTTVRVGDKTPDGSMVVGITASSVLLRGPNDKTDRTLKINNTSPIKHGRKAP